jgi:acylphosphatase
MRAIRIKITGRVYRTGYRYYVKQKASKLNIRGGVLYCPDRSVEIIAVGEKNDLDEFLKQCMIGNKDSKTEKMSITEIPSGNYDTFEVFDEK